MIDWYSTTAAEVAGLHRLSVTHRQNGQQQLLIFHSSATPDVPVAAVGAIGTEHVETTVYTRQGSTIRFGVQALQSADSPLSYDLTTGFEPSIACEHNGGAAHCVTCLGPEEPNQTPETARVIALNQRVRGAVCSLVDEHDVYALDIERRVNVRVESTSQGLRSQGVGLGNILFSPPGGGVGQNDIHEEGPLTVSTATLEPGRYLLDPVVFGGVMEYEFIVRSVP